MRKKPASLARSRILRDIRRLLKKMGASATLTAETLAVARGHNDRELAADLRKVRRHYEMGKRRGTWAVDPDMCPLCGGSGLDALHRLLKCRECGGSGKHGEGEDQSEGETEGAGDDSEDSGSDRQPPRDGENGGGVRAVAVPEALGGEPQD